MVLLSPNSVWAWVLRAFGIYLALQLGLFVIVGWVLSKTAGELTVPYLAFAIPGAIFLTLVCWLRLWEARGSSPRRLAFGWALSAALSFSVEVVALVYSGIELHLINPNDARSYVVAAVLGVPIVSFSMYRMALARIITRAMTNAHLARSQ